MPSLVPNKSNLYVRETHNVLDDAHRGSWRIDKGIADHKLFENIVLNRARQLVPLDALLLGGHNVHRQDGKNSSVHRHRDAHLVEWNAVEQNFHILDAINGYSSHSDVAYHAGVIAVEPAVRCQIKGYRQTLLACGKVFAVECIALLGRREASVLQRK